MIVVAVLVMFVSSAALAEELETESGIKYDEKVVWRGFNLYDGSSALSPFTKLNIAGYNLDIGGVRPNDEAQEDDKRLDLSLTKETEYGTFGYNYYNFPDSSSHSADSPDFHEFFWKTQIPSLGMPVDLDYSLIYITPFNSESQEDTGFLHILKASKIIEGVNVFGELTYNDGFEPAGLSIDRGFTHLLLGATFDIELENKIILRPAVYHQMTFDSAVNPDKNQTWYSISLVYNF